MPASLPFALVLLLAEMVGASSHNVTVDDTDPRIMYSGGGWTTGQPCTDCPSTVDPSQVENGTWHCVDQAGNTASFNFTGTAVWVRGVLLTSSRRIPSTSDYTFSINGVAMPGNNISEYGYNKTLFQATGLSDTAHALSIRSEGSTLLTLDSIIFAASTTDPPNSGANGTDSGAASTSSFPYNEASPSAPPNPGIVGGVVGGIFGLFLIMGVIAYFVIKRTNQKRGNGSSRSPRYIDDTVPPWFAKKRSPNSSGKGSSRDKERERERERQKQRERERERERRRRHQRMQDEYRYEGPKPVAVHVPLAESTYDGTGTEVIFRSMGSAMSSQSDTDGQEFVHALTTDVPVLSPGYNPQYDNKYGYGYSETPTKPPVAYAYTQDRNRDQGRERDPDPDRDRERDRHRDRDRDRLSVSRPGKSKRHSGHSGGGASSQTATTTSTLSDGGVLERVMNNQSPPPTGNFGDDHPFRINQRRR